VKLPPLPPQVQAALDQQLAFQWAGWVDPTQERELRHRRESQEQLRKIALDAAHIGVGAIPFAVQPSRGDVLQSTYDAVDPEREPGMAAAVQRLQYVRDHVADFGGEGLARAVVDLWRESAAPCRNVGYPERELLERLLVGAPNKKAAAVNLATACGGLEPVAGEVLGHAFGEGIRSLWKYEHPVHDFFRERKEARDELELLTLFEVAQNKCGLEWDRVDDFPPETEETTAGHIYTSRGCEPKVVNKRRRLYGERAPEYAYYEAEDGTWQRKDAEKYIQGLESEASTYLGYDEEERFNEEFWKRPGTLYVVVKDPDNALVRGLVEPKTTKDYDHAEYLAREFDRKLLELDTRQMKFDGFTPHVANDERTIEHAKMSSLAWKLGVEEWPGDDYDEDTIFIMDHVPAKYISDPNPDSDPEEE
jgi:hypothetical protein